MKISVNGKLRDIPDTTTVTQLIDQLAIESTQVAVALNHAFVPRSAYGETRLTAHDQVEILMPVAGG